MDNSKVLWVEGMFLRPQVFQQLDRYHENRLHSTVTAIHPYLWGIRAIKWDMDALRNNSLRAAGLSLIFPDGETYNAPHDDVLPDHLNLGDLPESETLFTIYIALPALSNPTIRKRAHFVPESHQLDQYMKVPVTRLRRNGARGFDIDSRFVPPSLTIEGGGELQIRLAQLVQKLEAKAESLFALHNEPNKDVVEPRVGDISSFWLLHTVNTSLALLRHYVKHPQMHPERLFEQLLGLAGSLTTYSRKHAVSSLPSYDHDDPGPAFIELDLVIRDLVDTVISSKYLSIPLTESRTAFHAGALDSGKIDQDAVLYLAVAADMAAIELVGTVPKIFKVGSPSDVDECVLRALPGVQLLYMPQVPAALPMRPNTFYFALDRHSARYANMLKAQAISIYTAEGIRDLKLELVAILA